MKPNAQAEPIATIQIRASLLGQLGMLVEKGFQAQKAAIASEQRPGVALSQAADDARWSLAAAEIGAAIQRGGQEMQAAMREAQSQAAKPADPPAVDSQANGTATQ